MTSTAIEVHGHCDPRFEAVREVFAANFEEFPEVGASVAVTLDGEAVVDLWAGYADRERTRPWEQDTVVNVFSTTKGVTALAAHMLADRGELDFEALVAQYWPEFAQHGKESMPVRYLMTHQAGLRAFGGGIAVALDWDAACADLAAQTPTWEPGTQMGYHAVTFGHLVGEVVRRIDGRTVGQFVRDEVAGPLGVDFLLGFGPEEDRRVADQLADTRGQASGRASAVAGIDWNARETRAAEIPAANGHTNARALARIYGALARGGEVDGVRLLSPEACKRAAVEQSGGHDVTLNAVAHRTLGFMLPFAEFGDVRPEGSWGHAGAGGSQGFADPARRLGFGYAMNQALTPQPGETRPPTGGMDPRGQRLVAALYGCF
ncbi:MAG: serine hydrolase [Dehalococcoidia bacterium]|nr:serine hydrolase [Dehalococcoidia bacterium]